MCYMYVCMLGVRDIKCSNPISQIPQILHTFRLSSLGGLIFCISNKVPNDMGPAGPWAGSLGVGVSVSLP